MTTFSLDSRSVEIVSISPMQIVEDKCRSPVDRKHPDDAFFVADVGDIFQKYKVWKSGLPRVEPFYAVKCNDDPAVLALLAKLNLGFDCASEEEIAKILNLGVPTPKIIYANPCKQIGHLQFAAERRVSMMTFDNMAELQKIKDHYPTAELVLRIIPPDDASDVTYQLGKKYGCSQETSYRLLKKARELDLNVIGVCFHVGSECGHIQVYGSACQAARQVFDVAETLGFTFTFLDIGGGFPGDDSTKFTFEEICSSLAPILDELFPPRVRIISEPGRFFVASAFTLVANVIGKREVEIPSELQAGDIARFNSEPRFMYYINEGLFGSFLLFSFDKNIIEPTSFLTNGRTDTGVDVYSSSLWGQTLTGLDCLNRNCLLPQLKIGDWLIFRNKGHYTLAMHTGFNDMPLPHIYYIMNEKDWSEFRTNL